MLLNVSGITKSFGAEEILSALSFRIDRKEKVALVGRNGTGKTTLLRIITRQLEPDGGSVAIARGAKIGYLRQEATVDPFRNVLQEAETSRKQALDIKKRLDELEQILESSPGEQEIEEYATLHEHYMELEGYSAERDVRTVLARMGFDPAELSKPVAALSGGEKTRLALALLLLEGPDLLLLDEPTNHLDLQATEWLESWLHQYPGAVLLVSHDRAFLNGFGDRFLHLSDGQAKSYPGPYEKFLKLREEEEQRQADMAKRQQKEIERLDEYVRRFMNSQRTAQARGRQKQMNKLIVKAVQAPKAARGMAAAFRNAKRSGDLVLEMDKVTMGFGERVLYRDLSWTVRNGERWGVVGENGAGKSTLVKNALGILDPAAGRTRLGSNVTLGYFAQDTVSLDPEQSPIDYMIWGMNLLPAEARDLLARFLITGDDVYRPIKTLSGGEKNKLALAGFTTQNPNLLVLDEPTNHLDIDSREALADILKEYKGTLVLVSHDRWLLEQVTDHTLDLRRQGATLFNGSYGEYRRGEASPSRILPLAPAGPAGDETGMSPRELSKEIGRLENVIEGLESDIAFTEHEIANIEETLANLPKHADVFALTRSHADLKEVFAGQMAAWEEQCTRLERLKAEQGGRVS